MKETGVGERAKLLRRNVELQEVKQICRTIVVYRFKGKEKQFVFNFLFNRKPVKSVKDGIYMIRPRSDPMLTGMRHVTSDKAVLHFWRFFPSIFSLQRNS